jgi:hypothetical protein
MFLLNAHPEVMMIQDGLGMLPCQKIRQHQGAMVALPKTYHTQKKQVQQRSLCFCLDYEGVVYAFRKRRGKELPQKLAFYAFLNMMPKLSISKHNNIGFLLEHFLRSRIQQKWHRALARLFWWLSSKSRASR